MSDVPARYLLALVFVQFCFGGLAVAAKFALLGLTPGALAALRVASAAVLLLLIERLVVGARAARPRGRDLAVLFGLSLLGVTLNQLLFLKGLALTTAVNAVLIIATIPALTVGIATLLGRERFTPVRLIGIVTAFAGVAVLVGLDAIDLGATSLLGSALVALNSLSYAFYLVLSRPMLARYDPLTVVAYTFAMGALVLAVATAPELLAVDLGALPTEALWGFAYVVLFGSVAAYGVNNWVLRHVEAGTVAAFIYLQPLVTAVLAVVLLDEHLAPRHFVAGAGILLGVFLASRAAPVRRAPAA